MLVIMPDRFPLPSHTSDRADPERARDPDRSSVTQERPRTICV